MIRPPHLKELHDLIPALGPPKKRGPWCPWGLPKKGLEKVWKTWKNSGKCREFGVLVKPGADLRCHGNLIKKELVFQMERSKQTINMILIDVDSLF